MQAAVLDSVRTELASVPLDLPSSILYPDFPATPDLGSAQSLPSSVPVDPSESSGTAAPAFIVDSLSRADWCIARVLEAEARITHRTELATTLHERIDAWLTKASASDNDSISYLSMILRPYVESEVSKQRRSRSLVLPSGTAQLRKLADRLEITNPEAAMAWAANNAPTAIIIKKELSRSVLKNLITAQGEAIPGCEFSLGSDELYVKPNA